MKVIAKKIKASERFLAAELIGDPKDPAMILNAGAGNQLITWPDEFCQMLVDKGYCVIRYDYPDCGLSTSLDFEKDPYHVLDLADDAIKILAEFGIEKAHFVGYSMGGQLAQLAAAYRPNVVLSIILMGTSTNFKPGFDGFLGIRSPNTLSAPKQEYIDWATRKVDITQQTFDEKIHDYVHTAYLLDGESPNFDRAFFEKLGRDVFTRSELLTPYLQHAKAMQASYQLHANAPKKIHTRALIIQGSDDPVFPMDHGEDLHEKIEDSELVVLNQFAHVLSPRHYNAIVENMMSFLAQRPACTNK